MKIILFCCWCNCCSTREWHLPTGRQATKADSSNTDHSKKVFLLFCFCIKLSCIL